MEQGQPAVSAYSWRFWPGLRVCTATLYEDERRIEQETFADLTVLDAEGNVVSTLTAAEQAQQWLRANLARLRAL